MSDTVTVIQADRELFIKLVGVPDDDPQAHAEVRAGQWDNNASVQLIARHRIAHEPKLLDDVTVRTCARALLNHQYGQDSFTGETGRFVMEKAETTVRLILEAALPTPPEQAE